MGANQGPPIVTFIGRSKSGKTTLLEKVIRELKTRGYRVATVKHHSHSGFEIDQPGKDSWRHAQAGSDHVVIAAPDRIASIRPLERELTLDEIAAAISGVDLILTEGYKRAGKPTVEVLRSELSLELIAEPEQLIAVVADFSRDFGVPHFAPDDVRGLVDFLVYRFLS